MKNKFYCQKCKQEFESEGKKVEYLDRFYGPCRKQIANCPICNTECDQQSMSGTSKKNNDFDKYVEELQNRGGGCYGGGGCCG